VLQVPELDVFDGIVLQTAAGLRFADADQVADITDRYVLLHLPAEETDQLGIDPLQVADDGRHGRQQAVAVDPGDGGLRASTAPSSSVIWLLH
jgi:hypothetical protein